MRYVIALTIAVAGAAVPLVPLCPALASDLASTRAALAPVGAVEAQAPLTGGPQGVAAQAQEEDDGPDVLLMALLTTGAAAGAAVLGLAGYVIRNRIGFWLHRPPPREGAEPEEHH